MTVATIKTKSMKKLIHFIGVDVSKETFDLALIKDNDISMIIQKVFSNDVTGFKELNKWLKQQKVSYPDSVFCVEHTGYYSKPIGKFIIAKKGNLWMEMSLKIIRSLGIQRGKNDKIDARRIALFAHRNQQDYKPYNPPRPIIEKLKTMLMLRQKLINSKLSITIPVNELKRIDKSAGNEALQMTAITLKVIEKNLLTVEQKIDDLIASDKDLAEKYKLVTSVPGIGKITFCYLSYYTNEFKNYSRAKQLACYCGVVPFEYTSGKSVRGKPRVHNMANKFMKKLLHTAALCAVTYYPEFKAYYERKINENKNRMLILNNVRNKLIIRVAAVIKNNQPYKVNAAA
jgi:transposase